MASATSLEYLQSIEGVANGLATLDGSGTVPLSQLPASVINVYLGEYATEAALIAAYPTAALANYAFVTDTLSYWYWNRELTPAAWVNQQISAVDYEALTAAQQGVVPYIISP